MRQPSAKLAALRPYECPREDEATANSQDEVLFLVHRIPFPPDKGDKIRSWRLLEYLSRRRPVRLGCFVDHPDDWQHVERLAELCVECHAVPVPRRRISARHVAALLRGEPLTLAHYRSADMARWTEAVLASGRVGAAIAYSGAMAQYIMGPAASGIHRTVDFVDLDSDKWRQYAGHRRQPLRWIYTREATTLLAFERRAAAACDVNFFVSEAEASLFRGMAPEVADRTMALRNGVDTAYFSPSGHADPFPSGVRPLVFTGAMDYWPNVDAVEWFTREVLPRVRRRVPEAQFWIVGSDPAPAVRQLAGDAVHVTGRVPDVRPYLAHAACVVAPLRVARGIQNKVLEGMAMGRPVVATTAAADGLSVDAGREISVADSAETVADAVLAVLADRERAADLGRRARLRVLASYRWDDALAALDAYLPTPSGR